MTVRLIPHIGYGGNPLFLHQQGYLFNQRCLVLLIRDLGDND